MGDDDTGNDNNAPPTTKISRAQQHHISGARRFTVARAKTMTSAREVWDAALESRIYQYTERLARYDGVERDARLDVLLPGIERRRARFESRRYANLTDEQRAVVDRMRPFGKVRAWATSNKEFE